MRFAHSSKVIFTDPLNAQFHARREFRISEIFIAKLLVF